MGHELRLEHLPITSGLHPMNGHRQTAPAGPFRAKLKHRAASFDHLVRERK